MEALADADALVSLSGHRHQSQWQIMALEEARPLLQTSNLKTRTISMTRYNYPPQPLLRKYYPTIAPLASPCALIR